MKDLAARIKVLEERLVSVEDQIANEWEYLDQLLSMYEHNELTPRVFGKTWRATGTRILNLRKAFRWLDPLLTYLYEQNSRMVDWVVVYDASTTDPIAVFQAGPPAPRHKSHFFTPDVTYQIVTARDADHAVARLKEGLTCPTGAATA